MTVNRPENLVDGVGPDQYQDSLRGFPEHAERVADRVAAMSPQDIEAGQREPTDGMIRLAGLMTIGHPADGEPVQSEIDAQYRAASRRASEPSGAETVPQPPVGGGLSGVRTPHRVATSPRQ